jgi:hypothetical protein
MTASWWSASERPLQVSIATEPLLADASGCHADVFDFRSPMPSICQNAGWLKAVKAKGLNKALVLLLPTQSGPGRASPLFPVVDEEARVPGIRPQQYPIIGRMNKFYKLVADWTAHYHSRLDIDGYYLCCASI